jgi:hypothetical protein
VPVFVRGLLVKYAARVHFGMNTGELNGRGGEI